ncbi:MAG: 5'-methylthioadenosine/adenosylhomocysteine nucleosidase [Atopobiaceae bacterium]|nr:5'-methylthioadenosine/adenosylhomocysteine nucleosidase [Atopobiaceae bacterium]
MATRIGIIGAMESEISHLRENLTEKKRDVIAGMEFFSGKLGTHEVIVVVCGVGKVNAALCANVLSLRFNVSHVINTGVAGSLDARINIGDIVVSTDAVEHDFDVVALGYDAGEIPGMGVVAFEADSALREAMVAAVREVAPEVSVFEGRVASGDQFVSTREQKERIESEFAGLCCEMEGAAIAHACHLANVPFVIVRAISDKADGSSHVDYRTFVREAANRSARIVEAFVRTFD